MPALAAGSALQVGGLDLKVDALDDAGAAEWAEGAVALADRLIADVHVMQALIVGNSGNPFERPNWRRGEAPEQAVGKEPREVQGKLFAQRVADPPAHALEVVCTVVEGITRLTISRCRPLSWICSRVLRTGSSSDELTSR